MKPITIWYRLSEKGDLLHNHIDDGHSFDDKPKPFSYEYTNQLAWEKSKWKSSWGYLDNGKVIY